jgi:MFS transporter, FHS family, L-fucose permease
VTPEQLRAIQAEELKAVMVPYIGLAILLLVILVTIAFPEGSDDAGGISVGKCQRRVARRDHWAALGNRHYRFGVIAQFFNIGAQVCTWTFTIQYVEQALNGSLELGGFLLQISLLIFLGSRFLMT